MTRPSKDMTGRRFGKWKVLHKIKTISKSQKMSQWLCVCSSCGEKKAFRHSNLLKSQVPKCKKCDICNVLVVKRQVQKAVAKMPGVKPAGSFGFMEQKKKTVNVHVTQQRIGLDEAKKYMASMGRR